MRKHLSKIFAFILSIIFICPKTFAVRPMSEEEHGAFVAYLTDTIKAFCKKNQKFLTSVSGQNFESFIKDIVLKCDDRFDATHLLCADNSHTFLDAMRAYHDHALFARELLWCRGLSLFALQELVNQGINCKYVTLLNKFFCPEQVLHNVITYQKSDGCWYVCDLGNALLYAIEFIKSSPNREDFVLSTTDSSITGMIFGAEKIEDFLSIPLTKYKERFSGLSHAETDYFLWDENEITPEFLVKPAKSIFDSHKPTPSDEYTEYYGQKPLKKSRN